MFLEQASKGETLSFLSHPKVELKQLSCVESDGSTLKLQTYEINNVRMLHHCWNHLHEKGMVSDDQESFRFNSISRTDFDIFRFHPASMKLLHKENPSTNPSIHSMASKKAMLTTSSEDSLNNEDAPCNQLAAGQPFERSVAFSDDSTAKPSSNVNHLQSYDLCHDLPFDELVVDQLPNVDLDLVEFENHLLTEASNLKDDFSSSTFRTETSSDSSLSDCKPPIVVR